MGRRVPYVTREEVMDAFETKESADRHAQVDDAILSASDDVDAWLNRHKHGCAPTLATRYFEWPSTFYGGPLRLWFDENELISATEFSNAGRALVADTDYFLEPVNSGPPYTYAELGDSANGYLVGGSPRQRSVLIEGVWGLEDEQAPAGTLTGAVNASVTAFQVSDASLVGVGSLLSVEDERALVTGRSAVSTGQTLASDLDETDADRELVVADGTALHAGEIVTVDTERMKVLSVTGNVALVDRAWDGSPLAEHLSGATVYADRLLTVERGTRGTTAASHSGGVAVTVWLVPDLIRQYAKAVAITNLEQEASAYGARVYSDEAERDSSGTDVVSGRGLTDVRRQCARRYKRKFRKRAI